jgi:hypothetical protein
MPPRQGQCRPAGAMPPRRGGAARCGHVGVSMELRCIRLGSKIILGLIPLLPGVGWAMPPLQGAADIHPAVWPETILNGGSSSPANNEFAPPGKWLELADRFYQASMDPSHGPRPQGVKMHGNQGLLTDVLKQRMHFEGLVRIAADYASSCACTCLIEADLRPDLCRENSTRSAHRRIVRSRAARCVSPWC